MRKTIRDYNNARWIIRVLICRRIFRETVLSREVGRKSPITIDEGEGGESEIRKKRRRGLDTSLTLWPYSLRSLTVETETVSRARHSSIYVVNNYRVHINRWLAGRRQPRSYYLRFSLSSQTTKYESLDYNSRCRVEIIFFTCVWKEWLLIEVRFSGINICQCATWKI